MEKLTDESPMPMGKHKGEKMANVPAKYLIWLYEQTKPIIDYIEDNMDALNKEATK